MKTLFLTIALFIPTTVFAAGPGTEMTRIINQRGLGSNCQRCKALANEMDSRGSDWVKQNKRHVANRTISNARALGHRMGPLKRVGVRMMINKSIRRSR